MLLSKEGITWGTWRISFSILYLPVMRIFFFTKYWYTCLFYCLKFSIMFLTNDGKFFSSGYLRSTTGSNLLNDRMETSDKRRIENGRQMIEKGKQKSKAWSISRASLLRSSAVRVLSRVLMYVCARAIRLYSHNIKRSVSSLLFTINNGEADRHDVARNNDISLRSDSAWPSHYQSKLL